MDTIHFKLEEYVEVIILKPLSSPKKFSMSSVDENYYYYFFPIPHDFRDLMVKNFN